MKKVLIYTLLSFNFLALAVFLLVQLSTVYILMRYRKIEFSFPKSITKKTLSIFAHLFLFIISNFLLVIALKMNFNSWLRSSEVEVLELTVVDKHISHGKATDYYIIFDSKEGRFHNKVSSKKYNSFEIGESFKASVNRGFFDGYYLSKPLK
jgi:heme/copper-type cytochrome/quinol oxidase subunit 2